MAGPVPASRPPEAAPQASLHQRILADVESSIVSGAWPPGHRIPSELELAQTYGCSRMTVNKVLTQLARAGMIERRRKAGSFVTRSHSRAALLEIQDIKAEVLALSLPYRFEVRERHKRRSLLAERELLGLLDVKPAGSVLVLDCLHYAGPRPFCFEQRVINLAAVPAAAAQRFDAVAPGAWLVDHVPWTSAEHRIRAEGASNVAAAALKLRVGAPCLVIERRTWHSEQPITHVQLTYPAEGREVIARFSPSQV
jgi:GntR family histidine utilization transcriptional repressor